MLLYLLISFIWLAVAIVIAAACRMSSQADGADGGIELGARDRRVRDARGVSAPATIAPPPAVRIRRA